MAYCPGCGFNNMEAVNFCTKCGIALNTNTAQNQNTVHEESGEITWTEAIDAVLKKEINQSYTLILGLFFLDPLFLMFFWASEGWSDIMARGQTEIFANLLFIFGMIALFHYFIKIKGINQGKSGFVLAALLLMGFLGLLSIIGSNFAFYNWANWTSEITTFIQIGLIFITWQKMKQPST